MCKFQNLGWKQDKRLQDEAIKYFSSDENFDFNNFIKDAPKEQMANLVEIIANKKFEEQYKSIDGLLYLLQDLSWPGSEKAMTLLKTFPKKILLLYLENALKEANKENDDNWLGNLKMLINYHSFTKDDFKNVDLEQVLEKAAW
ncbi:hypothetical protein [Treponema sp.]|uniref:hypothetical protein n=1 Tax=Treponema sp. TaxID=166 RepID=UPI00298E6B6D|nr:hypothetical protein [Treponema sp.]